MVVRCVHYYDDHEPQCNTILIGRVVTSLLHIQHVVVVLEDVGSVDLLQSQCIVEDVFRFLVLYVMIPSVPPIEWLDRWCFPWWICWFRLAGDPSCRVGISVACRLAAPSTNIYLFWDAYFMYIYMHVYTVEWCNRSPQRPRSDYTGFHCWVGWTWRTEWIHPEGVWWWHHRWYLAVTTWNGSDPDKSWRTTSTSCRAASQNSYQLSNKFSTCALNLLM